MGLLIFSIILLNGSPRVYAEEESPGSAETRVESATPSERLGESDKQNSSAEPAKEESQDSDKNSEIEEVPEKNTNPEKIDEEKSQTEEKDSTNSQENGEKSEKNPEKAKLSEEIKPVPLGKPSQTPNTFTVKKIGAGGSEETLVGEYDKFYDAVGSMDINDKDGFYTIYVNKDATVKADEMGGAYRSNNKFRITSGSNVPSVLRREGEWGILAIQEDCELTIDNITLDGSKTSQCLFISNNGKVTIGEGAVIQNFVDTANEDGPAILLRDESTLNIKEGATIRDNSSNTQGGAIQAYNGTTVNISGGTFSNNESNKSDGGFLAAYGELNITGGKFENNKAKKSGGAIIIGSRATAKIENATFEKNQARTGGAVYSANDLTIKNSSFTNNQAMWGGAVFASKKLTLDKVDFKNNTTSSAGGALYLQGGAEITDSNFEENQAPNGGAIYSNKAEVFTIKNSNISKNKATLGGGIYALGGNLKVENTTIESNNATNTGGGILSLKGKSLSLNKVTIKSNTSLNGAGLLVGAGNVDIKESEFNGNDTGEGGEQEKRLGGGIYIGEDANVNISQNTKFIDNKAGMGGAIFNANASYDDPAKAGSYQNLKLDETSLFKGNLARAGLYLAPENYKDFTNLKFNPESDTDHGKKLLPSLLNNYDINYQNANLLLSYDANGGKFDDDTELKQEKHKKDDVVTIIDGPKRQDYDFLYWEEPKNNPGDEYTLTDNHVFKAKWNKIPELEVEDAEIEEGQNLDPKDLITKAEDEEDGKNLESTVVIDKGSFDYNKAGTYEVKYTLTDKNGSKVTKTAKITVKKKSKPDKPEDKPELPEDKPEIPDYNPEIPEDEDEDFPIEDEKEEPVEKEDKNTPPVLEVKDGAIKVGEKFDPRSLITKAYDKEDGSNLVDSVIIDQGKFDNRVAGRYEIQYSLIDKSGSKVTKLAYVDVFAEAKKEKLRNSRENPKTGVEPSFALYSTIIFLSSSAYTAIRKKY